jgi:UDP-N-acetylglucosamine 1-carboxyvinyltransferase
MAMQEFLSIQGGVPLRGTVRVSGGKNAAVAIIPAALLAGEPCTIENLPEIEDVKVLMEMLVWLGAKVDFADGVMHIDPRGVDKYNPPYELVSRMRASYYLVPVLLGLFGKAEVSMPGGCAIGARPIDQTLKGWRALGVNVDTIGGVISADAAHMQGAEISLDMPSVGATINTIIAAVRAKGTTIIENPAREPHIVDVANFLNACGADIRGAGTSVIKINGVESLHGCEYSIIPDMIEAGTFMIAAAATKGKLYIDNVIPKHLETITAKLREMGVTVDEYDEAVSVCGTEHLKPINVKTLPYPGFPTDMHPQMAVLLCLAEGSGTLSETIWNNRFRYVDELQRMGAKILVEDKTAFFEGRTVFTPACVKAVDLRAGAAMVIAALATEGRTEIEEISLIERGYVDIVEKIRNVGGNIRKVYFPDNAQQVSVS